MFQRNIDLKNRVTVRIWPQNISLFRPDSKFKIGHVSLQTYIGGPENKGRYISFWPASEGSPCCCRGCDKTFDHMHTWDEDAQFLQPAQLENTFTFYSLSADAINSAYEARLQRPLIWTLDASLLVNLFERKNTANCTSLVFDLLIQGGLENLISKQKILFLGSQQYVIDGLYYFQFIPYDNYIAQSSFDKANNAAMNMAIDIASGRAPIGTRAILSLSKLKIMLYNLSRSIGHTNAITIIAIMTATTFAATCYLAKLAENYLIIRPAQFLPLMNSAKATDEIKQRNYYNDNKTIFHTLPDEVILKIINQHLDIKSQCNLRQTCRFFKPCLPTKNEFNFLEILPGSQKRQL